MIDKLERLKREINELGDRVEKANGGTKEDRKKLRFRFVAEAMLDPEVSQEEIDDLVRSYEKYHGKLIRKRVEKWLEDF